LLFAVEEFRNDAKGYGNVFVPADDWIGIPYEGVPFPFFAPACGNGTFPVGPPGGPTTDVTLPPCDPRQNTDNTSVTARADYDAGPVSFTAIYGYQDYTSEYRQVFSGIFEEGYVPLEQQSLELRLASLAEGPFEWVAGAFWMEHDQSGSSTSGTFGDTQSDLNVNTTTAIFGQGTYSTSDTFRLIAGLRYTSEEQKSLVDLVGVGLNEELTDTSKVTWKAGIEMDVSEDSLLYATASTGFTRGGQGLSQLTGELYFWDEETVTAYEIGSKNRFQDGALQLNAAFFFYDWEDYQLDFPTGSPDSGDFETRTQNVAGSTSITGIEIEGIYLITDRTRLDFSATYNNSEFADGEVYINGYQENVAPPGQPPVFVPLDPINMSGIDLPYAPGVTATLRLDQDITTDLRIAVEFDYNDGYWTAIERFNNDGSLKDNFWQESYTLWNAGLFYEPDDADWSISLYGKNLSEEVVIGQSNNAGPNVVGVLQNPRTYGITATYRF
jgi:iron complex outermembrane receptor protein